MSLFSKILNLFSKSSSPSTLSTLWHHRAPRIQYQKLSFIQFEGFSVANISSTGIALINKDSASKLTLGQELNGILQIESQQFPLSLKVVRITPDLVGCRFHQENFEIERALKKRFSLEMIAKKMLKMPSTNLKQTAEGTPYCFNGEENNQLFFIHNGRCITYLEFSFFGNYIEGEAGKNLVYGNLMLDEVLDKARYKGSTLIDQKKNIPDPAVNDAVLFLENIPQLDPQHLTELTNTIKNGFLAKE